MCEDGKSESTTGARVASSRVHPPSTRGRSSRLPSPDSVLSDPDFSPDRRITRRFLAESLMDMRIPRATPSPRPGKKRAIDEVVDDSRPPSPDKMLRELDQQHEEAKKAKRTLTPVPQEQNARHQGQDTKRQRTLAIRSGNPGDETAPTCARRGDEGNGNGNGSSNTSRRRSSSTPEHPKG